MWNENLQTTSTDLMALPSEFTLYISKKRHDKFHLNVNSMQGIFDVGLYLIKA